VDDANVDHPTDVGTQAFQTEPAVTVCVFTMLKHRPAAANCTNDDWEFDCWGRR